RFAFKHKRNPHLRVSFDLSAGSLLIMGGATQHYWFHQVPKTSRNVAPRINLTFRIIKTFLN
ncbi:alpha-ketoglutarate-dependent dioxygenase AlkB, partial [Parathermosynechococcus lividus]